MVKIWIKRLLFRRSCNLLPLLMTLSNESKTYKVFGPVDKVMLTSEYVIFDENESWNWGRSKEEVQLNLRDVHS